MLHDVILGTGCLAERALDGEAILAALRACALDDVLLVASRGARARDLEDVPVAAVRVHVDDAELGVSLARRTHARRLVLDLGEQLDVDSACRVSFALARAHPGLALAVLTPSAGPLAAPDALGLVLDDLAALPLGYWHRPARAHLQGVGDEPWLDAHAGHLVGMSLDDVVGRDTGLPPGLGELDFARTAELSGRSLVVALDLDPVPDAALLRPALEHLRRVGFP